MQRGDRDEPELENVRKDEKGPAGAAELEDDLADHPVAEQRDRDAAFEAGPAERDLQKDQHVCQVAELVESLVVVDATDRVHQEEIAEVRDDGEEAAAERPAQGG